MSKNQPSPVPNNAASPFSDGQNVVEIMIPGNRAGLIIGKGGETIKQLQVCLATGLLRKFSVYVEFYQNVFW